MSNLAHYKFSNLYTMSSGISSKPEQAGHGAPFLSFSAVFNNYFLPKNLADRMDTSKEEQEKYSIKDGDIFLTRTSEVVDELGMSSVALKNYPQATYSGFLKRLRPTQKNITYPKFMAFYLRSPLFRKTMTNNAVLTLRASLNEEIFSYLDLLLPQYNDQVKAGDFLYLLSQKIECNNRINAALEAMAKTLYDYWFVQFDFPDRDGKPYKSSGGGMAYNPTLKREIPVGWENGTLSNLISFEYGKGLKTDTRTGAGYPVVGSNGVVGYHSEYLVKGPGIVVGRKGTVGAITYIHDNFFPIDTTYYAKPVIEIEFRYLKFLLRSLGLEKMNSDSAVPGLNREAALRIAIVVPPTAKIQKFESKIKAVFGEQRNIQNENQQLTQLRDWLLPMLMNGQVTVA
jgi:type I restriction enzyme S subunit